MSQDQIREALEGIGPLECQLKGIEAEMENFWGSCIPGETTIMITTRCMYDGGCRQPNDPDFETRTATFFGRGEYFLDVEIGGTRVGIPYYSIESIKRV